MFKTLLMAPAICAAAVAAQTVDPMARARQAGTALFVRTAGTDFGDGREVAALYQALARGAEQACDSHSPRQLAVAASDAACAREALARAVAVAGRPPLTDLHEVSLRGPVRLTQR